MKIPIMSKILLCILGISAALLTVELSLRFAQAAPEARLQDKDFKRFYVDIYRRFFVKNGGFFTPLRPDAVTNGFPAHKSDGEMRIFIIGESVAALFPAETLEKKFNEAFPGHRWKVINCGMHAYDSYRIALVADEICSYKPDLLILMMGNNDGVHDPVCIPKYKYPLIYRSSTLSLIFNSLYPPEPYSFSDGHFRYNLARIASSAERRKIPLIALTLPRNRKMPPNSDRTFYFKQATFKPLWLMRTKPASVLEHCPEGQSDTRGWHWLMAKAGELSGSMRKASVHYRASNPNDYRNGLIRQIGDGRKYSVCTDFEKALLDFTDNMPGFEYFSDANHYWPPVYDFLSGMIAGTFADKNFCEDAIRSDPGGTSLMHLSLLDRSYLHSNIRDRVFNVFAWNGENAAGDAFPAFDPLKEYLKFCILNSPDLFNDLKHDTSGYIRKYPGVKFDIFFVYLAGALLEEHRPEDALYFLGQVRPDQRYKPLYLLLLGLCRFDAGQTKAAEKAFSLLHGADPELRWLDLKYLKELEKL